MGRVQVGILGIAFSIALWSPSPGAESDARFSWMLPKTVIDTTIAYVLEKCAMEDGKPNFASISPQS